MEGFGRVDCSCLLNDVEYVPQTESTPDIRIECAASYVPRPVLTARVIDVAQLQYKTGQLAGI